MKIRKTEIIAERERSVTVRFGNARRQNDFCEVCKQSTRFVSIDQAALICGATSLEIYRAIEVRRVHALETTEGFLIVCLASIAANKKIER